MSTILIVEDDKNILLTLSARLRAEGHRVVGAQDATMAMSVARKDPPDLALLDISIPGGNGFQVAQRLQQSTRTIGVPVIFITAFPERLLTGDRPEPAFVITKPYTEAQVRSAVSQAMFFSSTETLSA